MFKSMILLTRRSDMTHQEFSEWWLGEHAPMARQLPGVQRITFNLVSDDQDVEIDGITELWFNSREDFLAAYETEIGKGVAADSIAHVSGRVRIFVEETPVLG
jgi:uncharacterized protein (TIGR02118 family)